MKKLVAIGIAAMLTAPATLLAKGNHPMSGCGLGYFLIGSKENSKVMQVLAATTNGTSANQTFGISSGTSGCTEDGAVKLVKEAEVFAEVNLDTLRKEMAIGDGEFVKTFATLIGAKDVSQMVQFFHDNYTTLFPSSATTSDELLNALTDKLAGHPELISY